MLVLAGSMEAKISQTYPVPPPAGSYNRQGTGVATDPTGSGQVYQYRWPCCGAAPLPSDFFQLQLPGHTDFISRVVANPLGDALRQPIVIDARPGAGGALGTEIAARSAPDGYTLFMGNNSTHGSNPAIYPKLPYDAVKDFAPVTFVASVPYLLAVNPKIPAKTVQEFIALVKANPGKMNYASAGNGSTHHFCGELLKSRTGIDIVHVPYKGSGPGVAAAIAGDVAMMFGNIADIGAQVQSGRLRALAVTSAARANHAARCARPAMLPALPWKKRTTGASAASPRGATSYAASARPSGRTTRTTRPSTSENAKSPASAPGDCCGKKSRLLQAARRKSGSTISQPTR